MAEKLVYLNAFDDAVLYFQRNWSPSLPDQKAILVDQELRSIPEVCALVESFDDWLPHDVYDTLFHQMHFGSEDLGQELGKSRTYATAARCLLKLIERRARRPQSP